MPSYRYHCIPCNEDFDVIAHMDDAPPDQHWCGGPILRVYTPPRIGAGALETKGVAVRREAASEKQFSKDRDAYRRLRRNGVQPKSINGSSMLEDRAETQFEVDYGRVFPGKEQQKKIKEGLELTQEVREMQAAASDV